MSTEPWGARVAAHIARGRSPDADLVAELAAAQAPTLGQSGAARVGGVLHARYLGAGELQPLLDEPGVTDVVVNGDGRVWVDRGDGMSGVDVDLGDAAARRALAVRLAAAAGRRLDEAAPWCDAVLPNGIRVHAILPPLVPDGVHISLRVPAQRVLRLADLRARGMVDAWGEHLLKGLVARSVSFLVTGGTGAGKTTLLGALLAEVPARQRIVVVEDVRELRVDHPHVVRLEGRLANVEGAGEVSMTVLVRQALRMRPDRLVVGEVRGGEVRELLAALNTGHEGGCGTVHANSPADLPARLEALGALAAMPPQAVLSQLRSGVGAVVHVRRVAGTRVVDEIGVVCPDRDPLVRCGWSRDPAQVDPEAAVRLRSWTAP